MAESTGIGWTDATFNPWIGCTRVSKGCTFCYAEKMVINRMGRGAAWGPRGVRQRTKTWGDPIKWNKLAEEGRLPDGSDNVDGHRPRVFCASLADVFEPRPELEPWRDELFESLIPSTPFLDWQILTKRPDVALDYLTRLYARWSYVATERDGWPKKPLEWTHHLPNVWIGVSIEDAFVTHRADTLREIPAAVRFISAEPLVGSLFIDDRVTTGETGHGQSREDVTGRGTPTRERAPLDLTDIDWLIVGGESGGRDARPMHPRWARELRDACLFADVARIAKLDEREFISEAIEDARRPALFFKQWGSWLPSRDGGERTTFDPSPQMFRYAGPSPKAGGKQLDGREWCEFPERQEVPA